MWPRQWRLSAYPPACRVRCQLRLFRRIGAPKSPQQRRSRERTILRSSESIKLLHLIMVVWQNIG